MSWHFSQALVEEYLEAISLAGAVCVPLSGNPSQRVYSCSDRMMEFCERSPSGMMCERLTDEAGEALLMSFQAGFRAKTSAQPAAQTERD